jgi:hypothetical protein
MKIIRGRRPHHFLESADVSKIQRIVDLHDNDAGNDLRVLVDKDVDPLLVRILAQERDVRVSGVFDNHNE